MVESNCFYAMYGTIDSVDVLVSDFKNIVDPAGEVKWLNLIIYNPTHILNNSMVAYEMCEGYVQLERLMSLFSLDWALLAQTIGTDLTLLLGREGKQYMLDAKQELMPCLELIYPSEDEDDLEEAIDEDEEASSLSSIVSFKKKAKLPKFPKKKVKDYIEEYAEDPMCRPNYYEAGKVVGTVVSRVFMQKLEESRLP